MHLLNAQRNLSERHRFGVGRFDGSGDQGIRQRAGPPAFMSGQQTTQAPVVPRMGPVVHRLVAHLELDGDLMNPPAAGKLQQTQPTGSKVLMRMLAQQLLQVFFSGSVSSTAHFTGRQAIRIRLPVRLAILKIVYSTHLINKPSTTRTQ